MINIHGYVSGRVQGVGFRYFVKLQAKLNNVTGYAKNLSDGRVEFLLQGETNNIDNVIQKIHKGPPLSRVDHVTTKEQKSIELHHIFTVA